MAIESLNPANGERLATFSDMTPAEVDVIVDAAVRAQRAWARTSFA
jgi:acyl-CoA reductase-like NAD-dependent aldehyde dehydrogenase